jgi:hypothetical protein
VKDSPERWVLRRQNRFGSLTDDAVMDVSRFRRAFALLR